MKFKMQMVATVVAIAFPMMASAQDERKDRAAGKRPDMQRPGFVPGAGGFPGGPMAMLQLMGLEQLVAANIDDYVAKAIEVASNRGMNASIREVILAKRSTIFDCENASAIFAEKIIEAVKARAGT